MKKYITIPKAALFTLSLLLLCSACQKEPRITLLEETAALEVSAYNPVDEPIHFSSNRDWTVSCSEAWVHVQPMSGHASDDNVITLSFDSNESSEGRSAEVTILAEGVTTVVTVDQLRLWRNDLASSSVVLSAAARTVEAEGSSNGKYTVYVHADWLRLDEADGKLRLSVSENPSPTGRRGILELKRDYPGKSTVVEEMTVWQLGCASETPVAVDLGLSVKWASCNLGATRPEEPGSMYAWGETAPKDEYTKATYKWLGPEGFTKYCYTYKDGTYDSKTVLDLEDDAAYAAYGDGWHMPTSKQFEELFYYTDWMHVNMDGLEGMLFAGQKEGYQDKFVFIPYVYGPSRSYEQSGYWTCMLAVPASVSHNAYAFCVWGTPVLNLGQERWLGRPVRAVKD